MDISVLASVGSFVMSERVLKPKASVLALLGCLLAYDLTTKTHDVSSLRVYRGPGLLAFTLMMVAWSLRTWRRNGVACDELLFLPDTAHAEAVESSASDSVSNNQSNNNTGSSAIPSSPRPSIQQYEGDVAAGGWAAAPLQHDNTTNGNIDPEHPELTVEMVANRFSEQGISNNARQTSFRARSISGDSSLSSIREFADSWDEERPASNEDSDSDQRVIENEEAILTNEDLSDEEGNEMVPLKSTSIEHQPLSQPEPGSPRSNAGAGGQFANSAASERSMHAVRSSISVPTRHPYTRAERFRENHPQITRIGSFFFFRSSSTNVQNATYAPSGPMVVGAAMDLCMPTLFNFHLFIEAWNHLDAYETETPAKILPIIFLSVLIVRTVFPPGRRGRFWNVMKCTATAPFQRTRFRDCMIGDILTSLVRPLQDVVFALAYYVTVIWGTLTAKYDLSDSGQMLERSWILHNVVLPSCCLMPLWWKFLQTLRESYDTGRRWPYLGNAFKYLTAAVVILYGMTHPENRRSPWWILGFGAAMAYQIFWDTVMDWELFVIAPPDGEVLDGWSESSPWFSAQSISSVRPTLYWYLALQRLCLPIREFVRSRMARFPSYKQIRLRQRRLYKSDVFYWRIFMYNCMFRFCWMLSFIPAYHLSTSGRDVVTTFSSDTNSYVGVVLPLAEIFRRTLWGFLHVEMQTIRLSEGNPAYGYAPVQTVNQEDEELSSSDSRNSKHTSRHFLPAWLGSQQQLQHDAATNAPSWKLSNLITLDDVTREKLFFAELCVWAAGFVLAGMWACT